MKLIKIPNLGSFVGQSVSLLLTAALVLGGVTLPALAHHAMGGGMPANLWEGLLSGLAHPLIGPDHFAFVVAIGLLAATKRHGLLMPIAFGLAALLGTGMHLKQLGIPGVELFVSGSILVFGVVLALDKSLSLPLLLGLSALAGLCHGYAYGEAIFGAEPTPLLAYLIGFTTIQLGISLIALGVGRALMGASVERPQPSARLRSAGLVLCGVGLAFFASQVMSVLLPTP